MGEEITECIIVLWALPDGDRRRRRRRHCTQNIIPQWYGFVLCTLCVAGLGSMWCVCVTIDGIL